MKQRGYAKYGILAIALWGSSAIFAKPFAKGPYLGQTPPGSTPEVFAPGLISDPRPHVWECWATFSADGNTLCFYRDFYVYITDNTDEGWTVPKRVESIPHGICSPCVSPDANSIFFNQRYDPSRRWSLQRCIRTSEGWSAPQELGSPFTDAGASGGFSLAADNSVYFHSNRIPYGRSPFLVAPFVDNTWAQAISIPIEVGTVRGHSPGVAPDGSFMVFYSIEPGAPGGTPTDLYLALRLPNGSWSRPRRMGPKINTRYYEYLARISPDKKYMFFTRGNGWFGISNSDTGDIFWVALKEYLPESYR